MSATTAREALVQALCREFCSCLGAECDHQRARRFLAAPALDAIGAERVAALAEPLCQRICDMAGEPRLFIEGEVRAMLAAALADTRCPCPTDAEIDAALAPHARTEKPT